jgi:hypothetical protein
MSMRRVLASIIAVGLAGALAACGGHRVEPKSWTGQVCQALSPWRQQINTLNAQAGTQMKSATTPVQTRDNLLRLLDGARQASEDARVKVVAAGVPDVKDGKAIADKFVAALASVRDAYAKAQHTLQGLPTGGAGAFYDGVAAAMDTLTKEYAQAGLDTGTLASAELRKDFDEVPACRT